MSDPFIRFSGLVRKGLRFRKQFEGAKQSVGNVPFAWYAYDCFSNLFYIQRLLNQAGLHLEQLAGTLPVLDVGAADGALSFFLESLGFRVHACDYSGTNVNRMSGIRTLAAALGSAIEIHDIDLDGRPELSGGYGLALFLGTLYHVRNPFSILELLARHAGFCLLSTRVARLSPDKRINFADLPIGYLLEPSQVNADVTNYWIFSPAGLRLLVQRAGWKILAESRSGAQASDPVTAQGDERMFLLLAKSQVGWR